MKSFKLFLCSVFLVLLSSSLGASNYPREAYYQRVYVQDMGPYTAIRVANLCMNKWLLVYHAEGPLLVEGAERLEAHVFSNCYKEGEVSHRQHKVIPMGRDWRGSWNFFSPELSLGSLQNLRCLTVPERNAEVAFLNPERNEWDSKYSQNYKIPLLEIQRTQGYNTELGGCQHINQKAYEYIHNYLAR